AEFQRQFGPSRVALPLDDAGRAGGGAGAGEEKHVLRWQPPGRSGTGTALQGVEGGGDPAAEDGGASRVERPGPAEEGREIDSLDLLLAHKGDGGEILDIMDLELMDFAPARSSRCVVVLP